MVAREEVEGVAASQSQPVLASNGHAEAEPPALFFTLVFAGDLRALKRNPHTTDTAEVIAALSQAAVELDEAANIIAATLPSTAGLFRDAAARHRAVLAKTGA